MKRITQLLLPLALVAVVFAQETETAADLVKKLGNDDYAVREAATKKLIELGDQAVPELEKALRSDDLEVRLRAGRALRAIRGGANDDGDAGAAPEDFDEKEEGAEPGKDAPAEKDLLGPGGKIVSTSLSMGNGKVTVQVTRILDGKRETRRYEGASIEELKKKHPELKDVLGGFRIVGAGKLRGRMGLDMDKFWEDFGKDFGKGFNDEFWKKWQQDIEREAARLKKLSERWRQQWELDGNQRPWFDGGTGARLGVTVSRPGRVLDAQLELRGKGVVVETVVPGSLADGLGLKRFDVLVELNGTVIRAYQDVSAALKTHKQGDKLTAKVLRRAQPLALASAAKVPEDGAGK